MEIYLELLFCHLIGDYVLQSGYIAESKGENGGIWSCTACCI